MSNSSMPTIQDCMTVHLRRYFEQMGDREPTNVWKMALAPVERAILETTMAQYRGNQSRVAAVLGMSRNTLRQKLLSYALIAS